MKAKKRKTVDWKKLLPVLVLLTKKIPKENNNENNCKKNIKEEKHLKPVNNVNLQIKNKKIITKKNFFNFDNYNMNSEITKNIESENAVRIPMDDKINSFLPINKKIKAPNLKNIIVDQKNGPIYSIKKALELIKPGGIIR